MKKIALLIIFLSCTSCLVYHRGNRIGDRCRPNKSNFELDNIPFISTDKLNFNRVYIIDNVTKAMGYGFYPDGRLIFLYSKNGYELKAENVYNAENINNIVWATAPAIGYWRVDKNRIETEYFSCANSGNYIKKKGEIKGDTLIFYQEFYGFFKEKEVRKEKFILSDIHFDGSIFKPR